MSKSEFKREYKNLLLQGIDEIYVKIILADKYKDVIDSEELKEYLAEENNEIYEALIEGGFKPFHFNEIIISPNTIHEKANTENENHTETKAEAECETGNEH